MDPTVERNDHGNKATDLAQYSGDPNFMLSLAKGLAVLEAFGMGMTCPTIAKISAITGLSRAAVRRCLYTLSALGYAEAASGQHSYAINIRLSTGGLSSHLRARLARAAQPVLSSMPNLSAVCYSVTTLEADRIICIARTPTERAKDVGKYLDEPLPAYCTAMGRLLIASLPPASQESYLRRVAVTPFTDHTIIAVERLRAVLRLIPHRGYATCDEEYALGFCSTAVPIHLRSGQVIASLNASTSGNRPLTRETEAIFVPRLQRAASELSSSLDKLDAAFAAHASLPRTHSKGVASHW